MPLPGDLSPDLGLEGPVPAAWDHEGSTFPGDRAGLEDIPWSGEGKADDAPRFALCRLVLNRSEKAASAQESKKDEIYCGCCLAKEVAVATSCLARLEHRQAAPGSSKLRSRWMCSPSEDTELPTRGMNFFRPTWSTTGSRSLLRKPFSNYRIAHVTILPNFYQVAPGGHQQRTTGRAPNNVTLHFQQSECCEFKKSSGVDAFPSIYLGLKDKLSRIRQDFLVKPGENEKQPDKKGMNLQCEQQRPNSLLISLETRCMNPPSQGRWSLVEISGADVYLVMTYRSIDQMGSESNSCTLGNFWSILRNGRFSAWHSDVEMPLKMDVFGRTVYPNYPSKTLSFFKVT
ncbi:LOW QUALITY PROTEIN: tripartite motif-containing protein 16 [Theristicus caerulescens]